MPKVDQTRLGTDTKNVVDLDLATVRKVCIETLSHYGTSKPIASEVVDDLIMSEHEGYPSHGLMRIIDYVEAIKLNMIHPNQEPITTFSSKIAKNIDGQKGFGIVSARSVVSELENLLESTPLAVVGLTNSNHLGRLAHIGAPLAKRGFLVIGFVNYIGVSSKRVAPWRGAAGRLCTNPLLLAVPTGNELPIVVDFSTSTVSEGKIRLAMYNGQMIPDGWLVDKNWQTVNDPTLLYSDPPMAFMTPLGDKQGHKGFALGLFIDIIAGILTGGGYSQPDMITETNNGFFIAMHPSLLGQSKTAVFDEINDLANYCRSCPTEDNLPSVHIPGQRTTSLTKTCRIDKAVWVAIQALRI